MCKRVHSLKKKKKLEKKRGFTQNWETQYYRFNNIVVKPYSSANSIILVTTLQFHLFECIPSQN